MELTIGILILTQIISLFVILKLFIDKNYWKAKYKRTLIGAGVLAVASVFSKLVDKYKKPEKIEEEIKTEE